MTVEQKWRRKGGWRAYQQLRLIKRQDRRHEIVQLTVNTGLPLPRGWYMATAERLGISRMQLWRDVKALWKLA